MTKKQTEINPVTASLMAAQASVESIETVLKTLEIYRDNAAARIGEYIRMESDAEINVEAIKATVPRPYTILPINEHEAWLIHWRGVGMPGFGWLVSQGPAFTIYKVTRSMDLLTPLPAWMKNEMGWKPPEHKAVIDGTRTGIKVTDGDEATFRRKYGAHLGQRGADGSYKIKGGGAWMKLVASLVRDGILPYTPQPVDQAHWVEKVKYNARLREAVDNKQAKAGYQYLDNAVDEFHAKGALLVNIPPSAGKTFVTCLILHHFVGRVLILADSVMLIEQWKERVKQLAPDTKAEVIFSTYQGAAKYLTQKWDLIVPDEAQRLPANTFSKLAFAQTLYRLGLTGTAWREDDRQFLIVALSGFPYAIRWGALVASGVMKRPQITVATVPNEAAKAPYVKSLLSRFHKGRSIIFCDWIEQGQALADYLDVPFIHGATPRKLEKVQESPVCVVSRIGDRGLSLHDLSLVIEVAGQGKAREQFAQRVGRGLHGEGASNFYTVFTPTEAEKYRSRVFGVEAELAGEVEIRFINAGDGQSTSQTAPRSSRIGPALQSRRKDRGAPAKARKEPNPIKSERAAVPPDVIGQALAVPSVAAKVQAAQKTVNERAAAYVPKVLRFTWETPLSVADILDGLGITNDKTPQHIRAACRACIAAGLMTQNGELFGVNHDAIKRLQALNNMKGKG